MNHESLLLFCGAIAFYLLVLLVHSIRDQRGSGYFYALLGALAILSWCSETSGTVEIGKISFMISSTVFFTSLLLGVFVIYVFDGPQATRTAIFSTIGLSALYPIISILLYSQSSSNAWPVPPPQGIRIYAASIFAVFMDLTFLAVAWEFLGKPQFKLPIWGRTLCTLLGVLWLDSCLFTTCAFLGTPEYPQILKGSLLARSVIGLVAFPFLYGYLVWWRDKRGHTIERRPVLAIVSEITKVQKELTHAQSEIDRHIQLVRENEELIRSLQSALSEVKTLRGILPTCSFCKAIRNDKGHWMRLEHYIQRHSQAQFSHGICGDCAIEHYPDLDLSGPPTS